MSDDSLGKNDFAKKGWGIPGALFLGLSAYFIPNIVLVLLVPSLQVLPVAENIQTFLITAIFEAITIATIYIFVRAYGFSLRDLGLVKFKPNDLWLVLLGFGIYFVASIAISSIVQMFIGFDQNQPQEIGFTNPVGLELVLVFLVLVVLAPLAEELLFRGFIFKGMRKRLSFWWAAIITSALFALIHWQINVGLDVFALSLVLCWLRERTGSLWPSIMLHATKNGLAFLLLFTPLGQWLLEQSTNNIPY
jgi:membrane protease YdiL (CAAX protease family)